MAFFLVIGALARPLPRTRVRARALAAHRQVPPVAPATVAANLHQPLDVQRDLFPKVPLDAPFLLDDAADLPDILFRQVLHTQIRADAGGRQNVVRSLPADAVDVGEPDLDPLGSRQVNASYARH